jgi:IclR family pca regulon transcriptional regulator
MNRRHARLRDSPVAPASEANDAAVVSLPSKAIAEIAAYAGDPDFMTSLARGLAVLCGFSQQQRRLSIAQLSNITGIPRAAVRRCLHTLANLGYVASDDDGRIFELRPKVLSLGHAYLSSVPLATSAQPVLDRVSAECNESCSLSVLDGTDIVYVARSLASMRIMSIELAVGSRLPAYCTSMGRVLLASLPPHDAAARLRGVELTARTARTVTSRERLAAILDDVRDKGCALVDQELELGLRSLAVPVVDYRKRVVAAVNISVQADRLSAFELQRAMLDPLRAAASELGLLAG